MRLVLRLCLCYLLSGCETYLVSTKEKPDCPTTINGYFKSLPIYSGMYPVIILKKNDYEVLHGVILELSDSTVFFDEDKGVYLFDPKPKKYNLTDVAAVVNERGVKVYGTIPKKYLITWQAVIDIKEERETSDLKFTRFKLIPNQPFAYCIEPGNYRCTILNLYSNQGDILFCNPHFWFPIIVGKNNYIGTIILDPDRYGESYSYNLILEFIVQKPPVTSGIGAAINLMTPTKYVERLFSIDTSGYVRRTDKDTIVSVTRSF